MKKVAVVLILLILLVSMFSTAFAGGPSNASILEEYEKLIDGNWAIVGTYSDYEAGLGKNFSYNQKDGMLFITSDNEVYFIWYTYGSHSAMDTVRIAFSADGNYLLVIHGDETAAVYKRN